MSDQTLFDEPEVSDNGHKALPYLDPQTRRFYCSKGQVIRLSTRAVNPMIVMQLQTRGKPEVPKVEVLLLGKHHQIQENPNDPAYKAALVTWQQDTNNRVMQYILCTGVDTGPVPDEFVTDYLDFIPDARVNEIKYAYITSLVPLDDFGDLMEAILGEHEPTATGMDAVADSFRREGER